MFEELGELSGYIIIGLFLLLGFRHVLKAGFKTFSKKMDKTSSLYKSWVSLMVLNKKAHAWIGYGTIIVILIHVYLQTGFQFYIDGQTLSGGIASWAMVANVLFGILGEKVLKKPRPTWWLWVHRILTIGIGILILIHID